MKVEFFPIDFEEVLHKKSRFSESQIINILKQAEAGTPVPALCREHGMRSESFYKWRSKYGGMDASMITRKKEPEEENRRLKKMYAEARLKAEIATEALQKSGEATKRHCTRQATSTPSNNIHAIFVGGAFRAPGFWHFKKAVCRLSHSQSARFFVSSSQEIAQFHLSKCLVRTGQPS